jgi:acyl-CoA synthetase (AMP-forming)/AMP-acid ligase II
MGFECVPLYDSLGENAIEYIINHSESVFVVLAAAKLTSFAASLPKVTQPLKGVVYWGSSAPADTLDTIASRGIPLTSFDEFVVAGSKLDVPADPPVATDCCTIMYTSGTTGDPKGVMLTHAAIVACLHSMIVFMHDNDLALSHGARFPVSQALLLSGSLRKRFTPRQLPLLDLRVAPSRGLLQNRPQALHDRCPGMGWHESQWIAIRCAVARCNLFGVEGPLAGTGGSCPGPSQQS